MLARITWADLDPVAFAFLAIAVGIAAWRGVHVYLHIRREPGERDDEK